MCQNAIADADYNNEDQTGNFPVVGDTTIVVEVATGLALIIAEDFLAGGQVTVMSGTGVGDMYNILGSKFGSTDTNIALVIDSPIRTTWTTSTQIGITPSLWSNTLVFATSTTGTACGVPLIAVDVGFYYWSQVAGPTPIICDATETTTVGGQVGAPASMGTAGRVGLAVTVLQKWGTAMTAESTAAEAIPIWLELPG
jgi:hypothetical protein